ncbi:DUF6194 family protein [Nocardia cerradoensis]|uniref:DUF6194 family protein n=1 Tax=Nocardia cerradoensis TaxID=85688 RepID=UPI0002D3417E|nr:DUF6194 family protein [Nocardia cerradoensis]NKY44246.1 hypothetical protein [Nocardia cerradoensis]
MEINEIIEFVENLGGVLTLKPGPGDGTPEISWGDTFFYYAPDGVVPRTQPFATIVTKNYPDDESSRLDRPNTFRLNIFAGKQAFTEATGHTPRDHAAISADPSIPDTLFPHPVYGAQGWLAAVNPGPHTATTITHLLQRAHHIARTRYERRESPADN